MVDNSTQTDQHHRDVFEMLGAYALDAVSEEERQRIAAHVESCPVCAEELAYLTDAAEALPLGVDEQEPPAHLRNRIAAIGQTPQQISLSTSGVTDDPAAPADLEQYRGDRGRGMTFFVPWVAAAILLIAVIGLVAWNVQLRSDLQDRPTLETIAVDTTGAEGAEAELLYFTDQEVVILDVRGLPQRDEDEIYQVWLFQDGQPVPAGLFDEPADLIAISAQVEQFEAVGVTIEPGPIGSPQPTSDPVLVSEIS